MNKRFWLIIAFLAVGFVGFLWANNKKDTNKPGAVAVSATAHIRGNAASKIKFVEYGDFQCPACSQYEPLVTQAFTKYKDQVSFQFRNLPLTQIHPNALAAARAAQAASNQNKFWEMHDMLYRGQSAWVNSKTASTVFESYAKDLKLDLAKFKIDAASEATNSTINADKAEFRKLNLPLETPTFLIDGKKVEIAKLQTVDDFYKYIDEAIKNHQADNTAKTN